MTDRELWDRIKGRPWCPQDLEYRTPDGGRGIALWFLTLNDFYHDEADIEGEEWKRQVIPLDDRAEVIETVIDPRHAYILIGGACQTWLDENTRFWGRECGPPEARPGIRAYAKAPKEAEFGSAGVGLHDLLSACEAMSPDAGGGR